LRIFLAGAEMSPSEEWADPDPSRPNILNCNAVGISTQWGRKYSKKDCLHPGYQLSQQLSKWLI
jgi:hypothetical protein